MNANGSTKTARKWWRLATTSVRTLRLKQRSVLNGRARVSFFISHKSPSLASTMNIWWSFALAAACRPFSLPSFFPSFLTSTIAFHVAVCPLQLIRPERARRQPAGEQHVASLATIIWSDDFDTKARGVLSRNASILCMPNFLQLLRRLKIVFFHVPCPI